MESVSDYPLIIMATDSLPQWARNALTKRGLRILDVPHLSPAAGQHSGFDPSFVRFNDAWTKVRIFGLTEFERLILIDSDMVFLKGMDELFDYELPGKDWIAAAPACVCNPFQIAHYPEDWYVYFINSRDDC
jgi:alpha-N-acetylglucosamine transferase